MCYWNQCEMLLNARETRYATLGFLDYNNYSYENNVVSCHTWRCECFRFGSNGGTSSHVPLPDTCISSQFHVWRNLLTWRYRSRQTKFEKCFCYLRTFRGYCSIENGKGWNEAARLGTYQPSSWANVFTKLEECKHLINMSSSRQIFLNCGRKASNLLAMNKLEVNASLSCFLRMDTDFCTNAFYST